MNQVIVSDSPRIDRRLGWTLVVALGATFLAMMDAYIVNVAIPTIRADLGASDAGAQATVTGYLLAYSVFLVTGGRLGQMRGYKFMFVLGLAAFTLSSLACGLASNAAALVVFRCAQGLAAGLFFPQVLAILQTEFSGAARNKALALFGGTIGAAAIVGQIAGGILLHFDVFGLSWRAIFLVNLPLGVALTLIALRQMPSSRVRGGYTLDLGGVSILTAALLAVLVPLTEGSSQGWPVWSWLLLCSAVPLAVAFIRWESRLARTGGSPLLRPGLLRVKAFRAGNLVFLLFFACNAGFFFVLAQFLQDGLGYSPLGSALVFAPLAVAFTLTSLVVPRVQARIGLATLKWGYGINAAGYLLLLATSVSLNELSGMATLPALLLIGIGQGLGVSPLLGAALGVISAGEVGTAAGALETTGQIGMTLGVAVLGFAYYGTLGTPADYSSAFTLTLVCAAGLALLAVAAVPSLCKGATDPA